jgi:phenylacetate-CoA ligase
MQQTSAPLKQSLTARSASWAVRSLIFPLWIRRDHPTFPRYYSEFQRTQFLTKAELEALQLDRLRRLLRFAKENCPFYAQRMEKAGVMPEAVVSLEQFSRLPVLTKRDIQDHGAELRAKGYPADKTVRNQTGGSTGSPLQFYVDRERFDSRKASTLRHNLWAGMRPGDWQASLWGSRLDQGQPETWWDHLRNKLLYRTVALNTSRVSDADWAKFTSEVRRARPVSMVAYTQAAVQFARYLRQQKIDDIRIGSIITTAEMLLPGQREFLEETFGGKVFNRYGCREVSVIASECEYHRGMHVNAEALLVEIVPDEMRSGRAGKIVVTDLLNYSMPLIRYEIGDVAEWAEDQNCPCGRHLPLLGDVQGRTTDFLILSDGRQISGPALTLVVSDMADVRQVQFEQRTPELVVLRVVPGKNFGPSTEQELRKRIGMYLGDGAALQIEQTDSIQSEISGKYRFVVRDSSAPKKDDSLPAAPTKKTHAPA